MKTFAFALLVASINAFQGYGRQPSYHQPAPVVKVTKKPGYGAQGASKGYGQQAEKRSASDFDAYGRDQDLSIEESYGRTAAKSYAAESYDEWDNTDDDKWGAQAWGQDRDVYGASSYGKAASSGDYDRYGKAGASQGSVYGGKKVDKASAQGHYGASAGQVWKGASAGYGAARGGYDNDVWAKQAYGSDYDSRWGKSYDSVEAKSYDNENYARRVRADDDQWAEDYDRYDAGEGDAYGKAASASSYGKGAGYGKGGERSAASKQGGQDYWGKSGSDWDAWGRDQDYAEDVSYDRTTAKAYAAESYDEWDNADDDKWGAQAWGKDRDVYGASSYGAVASAKDASKRGYGAAGSQASQVSASLGYGQQGYGGHGYGHGGYGQQSKHASQQSSAAGYGRDQMVWQGASASKQAAAGAYDNDEWAKQAYGSDYDSRWGKSYDSVSAKSYDSESYARAVQADDDQWAEDYDRYDSRDAGAYGQAASKWGKEADKFQTGHGYGYHGASAISKKGAEYDAASQSGKSGYWGKSGSDWDAYGRDQDLSIKESYDRTWAKSYDAESYDEWDNKDDDKYGAQAWGKDRDVYGASSVGKAASAGDYDAYGRAGYGQASQKQSIQGSVGYGGHGGYGQGYGKSVGYGKQSSAQASAGKRGYGAHQDAQASRNHAAARSGYDNDEWAKQAYGSDFDSRWGKSYDSVAAKSYDDEQYARKVQADDDQWAEDYDRYDSRDADRYGRAASAAVRQPGKVQYSVSYPKPQPRHHAW